MVYGYLTIEATVCAHNLRLSFMSISSLTTGISHFIIGEAILCSFFFELLSKASHASDR
ncbi:hypothetical protein Hanom_Chr11g01036111 [Helianthus anomalus]